jgi:predicted  nucleic acid-binding Zn-ribbon protein
VETLEAQIASAHADLETLRTSHLTAASDAEKLAQTEAAFLKVQSEVQASIEATKSLKADHQIELQNAQNSITELESRVAQLKGLEAQIAALNLEKEDNAGKVSELEVEILELKEAQEGLEDNRDRLQDKLSALEENLANSSATIKLATEEAASKGAEHLSQLNELKTSHEEQLKQVSVTHEEVVASLASLQSKLEAASSAQELATKELLAAQDSHSSHIKEIEEAHVLQKAQLSEEMEVIKRELEVRMV